MDQNYFLYENAHDSEINSTNLAEDRTGLESLLSDNSNNDYLLVVAYHFLCVQ